MPSNTQSILSSGASQVLAPKLTAANGFSVADIALLLFEIDREITALGHRSVETLTQNMKVLVIAGAARRLLAKPGRTDLVMFLLECVPAPAAERPPTVFVRLEAILQSKGQAAGLAELRRLIDLEPMSDGYLFQLYSNAISFLHTKKLSMDEECYETLWGAVGDSADLEAKLQSLKDLAQRSILPARWIEFLRSFQDGRASGVETFDLGLQKAMLASLFLASIVEIVPYFQRQSKLGRALSPKEKQIFKIAQQRASLISPTDMRPIEEARDKGLSIVVLQTHAGMRNYVSRAVRSAEMPCSLIGNGELPHSFDGDFHVVTSNAETLPFAFTKLCKLMRKGPRIVRIFPDGRQGGELRKIEVLGKTVEIGMGGSTLAYYGNSALFFASTRWTGTGYAVDFLPGPVITPGTTREECDQIFADFYAEGIRKIILGPPEDMGLVGGFWPQILAG